MFKKHVRKFFQSKAPLITSRSVFPMTTKKCWLTFPCRHICVHWCWLGHPRAQQERENLLNERERFCHLELKIWSSLLLPSCYCCCWCYFVHLSWRLVGKEASALQNKHKLLKTAIFISHIFYTFSSSRTSQSIFLALKNPSV